MIFVASTSRLILPLSELLPAVPPEDYYTVDVLMFMYDDDLMLSVKRLIWYHIVTMRTTLTLDESVADGLKILQQKNPDKSFKEIVNDLIKQGLQASGVNTARPEKFVVEPCGGAVHRPEYNFDNIGKLIETIEGDFHK